MSRVIYRATDYMTTCLTSRTHHVGPYFNVICEYDRMFMYITPTYWWTDTIDKLQHISKLDQVLPLTFSI